jgi:hypothetical protein
MHQSVQRLLEAAKDKALNIGQPPQDSPQLGAGALSAMARQGFKELGAAFGKAFPDSVQIDEPGTLGNVTPAIVTAQMTGKEIGGKDVKQMDMDADMDR